jgi:hypothetical protein
MLKGYKTYITAALAVLSAVGAYLAGDATLAEAGQLAFTAVMAVFIRSGVKADTA